MITSPSKTGERMRADSDNRVKHIFRSLSNRNYRLYFAGQLVSFIGTWMQQLALSWLTYRLTQSPFMLGAITFASQGPSILLGPFAGVVPDMFNRHKLLIVTQTLLMLQSFLLAFLSMQGHIEVWQLIALGAFAGLVNAVDMPTRQAFVIDMTEKKEELVNVIALNASLMNLTRLIGPALAGVVVAKWGETSCFMLNSFSFLAVIAALLFMKLKSVQKRPRDFKILGHLRDGFSYVSSHSVIKFLLISTALSSLSAVPFMVLMPVYVKSNFHGDAQMLGYMMAASSIGSLCATLILASRKTVAGLSKWQISGILALSASLVAFGLSTQLWISLLAIAVGGYGITMQMASSNTMLQTIVEDDKRGRVMSLFTMAFLGTVPLGGLLAGYLAGRIGCNTLMFISALMALCIALFASANSPKLAGLKSPTPSTTPLK